MRNLLRLLAASALIVLQVVTFPNAATDSVETKVYAEGIANTNIALNPANPAGLEVKTQAADFDAEVLAPLRAAQAAEAARLAAARVRTASAKRAPVYGPATGDNWYRLRLCESGNDYAKNTGNGYYGAYQFDIGTWNNYGGYARADLAPPAVQDAKALDTYNRRGWAPWPACARKLGLM